MPMRRELYPDDWEQIALRVKNEADWKCECCGKGFTEQARDLGIEVGQ